MWMDEESKMFVRKKEGVSSYRFSRRISSFIWNGEVVKASEVT